MSGKEKKEINEHNEINEQDTYKQLLEEFRDPKFDSWTKNTLKQYRDYIVSDDYSRNVKVLALDILQKYCDFLRKKKSFIKDPTDIFGEHPGEITEKDFSLFLVDLQDRIFKVKRGKIMSRAKRRTIEKTPWPYPRL